MEENTMYLVEIYENEDDEPVRIAVTGEVADAISFLDDLGLIKGDVGIFPDLLIPVKKY